ncbi:MAG: hypothetical protein ACI31N_01515, partial [Lacticaseibacillus absianus]
KSQSSDIQHAISSRVGANDNPDRDQHVPIANPVTEKIFNLLYFRCERRGQNKAQKQSRRENADQQTIWNHDATSKIYW